MLGCVIVELEELGSTVVAVELPLSGFDADVAAARLAIEAARAGKIVEWPTDHCPFLSRPRELAALLVSDRP